MASDHWQLQCSTSFGCHLDGGQRPAPADLGPSFLTSHLLTFNDSTPVCSAARSGNDKQLAAQMGGLTVSISENLGGLQIMGSALGKEGSVLIYSPEERMQAIQRVWTDDDSLQVSDGFQGLQIDSPFPSMSELIPTTPATLLNETCQQLEPQKDKSELASSLANSFQLIKSPPACEQLEPQKLTTQSPCLEATHAFQLPQLPHIGNAKNILNSGTASQDRLQEDQIMTCSTPMKVNKGKNRHHLGERERRKEINDLIGTLQAFLPHRISKMDKATILSESLEYIKELQQKMSDLQNRKAKILETASKSKHQTNHDVTNTTELRGAIPDSSTYLLQALNPSPTGSMETALTHRRIRIDESLTADRGYFQKFSTNNMSVNISGDMVYFHLKCPRDILLDEIMKVVKKQLLDIVHLEISMNDSSFKELRIQAKATQADVLLTNSFFVSLIQRSCLSIY